MPDIDIRLSVSAHDFDLKLSAPAPDFISDFCFIHGNGFLRKVVTFEAVPTSPALSRLEQINFKICILSARIFTETPCHQMLAR